MDMPQLAFLMESAGMGEWVVLLAVVLIVMGPQRLPEMARKLGRWTETFRRAADEFKRQIMAMDQEVAPPEPEPDYSDYDHGSGEGSDMSTEAVEPDGEPSSQESPPSFSETGEPELQDAHPSEGLPESAQYYGNEELVAGLEAETKEEEKQE